MKHWKIIGLLAIGVAGGFGCGDDPEPPAAEPDAAVEAPDASTVARVEASVAYTGSAEGTLILAAFASVPPMGPPMGFAQVASPSFPQTLAVEDLPAGNAHILAILDVPPASPTQPGPEDRSVWSEPLVLVEGQTETITLTLVDP